MNEQRLAAMAREPMLHEVQKVAQELAEQAPDLMHVGQGDELLHEPRARLAAGDLELLAVRLGVDALEEEPPLLGVAELVQLEHLVGAREVLLLLGVEEAVEGHFGLRSISAPVLF